MVGSKLWIFGHLSSDRWTTASARAARHGDHCGAHRSRQRRRPSLWIKWLAPQDYLLISLTNSAAQGPSFHRLQMDMREYDFRDAMENAVGLSGNGYTSLLTFDDHFQPASMRICGTSRRSSSLDCDVNVRHVFLERNGPTILVASRPASERRIAIGVPLCAVLQQPSGCCERPSFATGTVLRA